jgi:hypothetical protein
MSDVMLLGVLRMPMPENPDPLTLAQFVSRARQAADRIEADAAKLDRMDEELRRERDPRAVVQRALIMAAMLPHNKAKQAGAVRDAAVALFGQENVDAAMQVWRWRSV